MAQKAVLTSAPLVVRPGDMVAYRMPSGSFTPAISLSLGSSILALRVVTTSDGSPSSPEKCAPEFTTTANYGEDVGCWKPRNEVWPETVPSIPSTEEAPTTGESNPEPEILGEVCAKLDPSGACGVAILAELKTIRDMASKTTEMLKNGRIKLAAGSPVPDIAAQDLKNFPEMLSMVAIAEGNLRKLLFI